MTVSSNYPVPVYVNGYVCKNCTDVDLAKKHIDPAHPRSGPYGIDAENDPTVKKAAAVTFGGSLSELNAKMAAPDILPSPNASPARSVRSALASALGGAQMNIVV